MTYLIYHRDIDLLDIDRGTILHICNVAGGFGKGVAGKIADKYSVVKKEYKRLYYSGSMQLGDIQLVQVTDHLTIVNLFAMSDYRQSKSDTKCYLLYDELHTALLKTFTAQDSIFYIPYKMGCGNAGGDWDIVKKILIDTVNEVNFTDVTRTVDPISLSPITEINICFPQY